MSASANVQVTTTIAGQSMSENKTITGEGVILRPIRVPAAKNGSLTTRTDANTGVATMDSGHGFTTSDVLDVYWTNADGTKGARYGMTATVATNAVTVDGGAGDDLPVLTTVLKVSKPVEESLPQVAADGYKVLALSTPVHGHFDIQDGGGSLLEKTFPRAGGGEYHWHNQSGETNPLAGDTPTKVLLSHGDAAAQDMLIGILFD